METKRFTIALFFASILAFSGCGGGGGGSTTSSTGTTGGIGGTGVSSGTITGFGSVFVNGVEFETADSSFAIDDDSNTSEDNLSIGMVVKVEGSVNDDGVSGTSTLLTYDASLKGPISSVLTTNADLTEVSFTLLNTPVIISSADTSFSNTTLNGLLQGDMVEASGFYDSNGILRATYLEKKNTAFVANSTLVEAKGTVASYNGSNQFALSNGSSSVQVNISGSTELTDLPNNRVANGLYVKVKGTMTAFNAVAIAATGVQNEGYDSDQEDVSIQGLVTNYVSISSFKVAGVSVNGANAELEPSNLTIVEGSSVEVEGNIVNGVLIASKVQGRDGSIEAQANVSAVDAANGTFTLSIGDGTLTFYTDTQTRFEDNVSDTAGFGVSDITNGDYLDVEAFEDASGHLIASRVQRESQDDDRLKGPVDTAVEGTNTLTILGISFSTAGSDFQNTDDSGSTSAGFYAAVQVGDLVRVTDNNPANGVADEVEFELEDEAENDNESDD